MSQIQKFLFDGLPVRGSIVRLTDSWQEVLKRRASNSDNSTYPAPVQSMLGEMVAGSVLLQSSIRFNGALVLQMQGEGPIKMAVAEVLPDLGLRATTSLSGEIANDARLPDLINPHDKGHCAIILDPLDRQAGQQPYQGIVPLVDAQGQPLPDVAHVLENYMRSSEQLETTLLLAANDQVAAGLLLQRLPVEGAGNLASTAVTHETEDNESPFQRLSILARSLKVQELLELDIQTILHRLFWNEKILRFAPDANDPTPHFHCNCNAERVTNMLRSLGRSEAESILAEQGFVHVDCNFCGQSYHFDAVEIMQIFTPAVQQPPSSEQPQ